MADRPRLKSPLDNPPEPAPSVPAQPQTPPRGKFRFGIAWMFGFTFLVALAAAAYGGLTRESEGHAYYVIYALITPFIALAIASILFKLKRRTPRRMESEQDPWQQD